jgi:predicted ATPase
VKEVKRAPRKDTYYLPTEQGFSFWLVQGAIVRGWALAEQGQVEEGTAQMQQGLATYQALGAELSRIRCLPMLAAGYAKAGQVEEGLSVLAEALEMMDRTDERWNEAELYWLKGELTLQSSAQSLEAIRKPLRTEQRRCHCDSSCPSFSERYKCRNDMAQTIRGTVDENPSAITATGEESPGRASACGGPPLF